MVHGCLHLLGFDHEDEPQAAVMESLERAILAGLGYPDPYVAALTATALLLELAQPVHFRLRYPCDGPFDAQRLRTVVAAPACVPGLSA